MVPNLITALTGPLSELEERILEAAPIIERWLRMEWMEHTPPIYATTRIHNAGFKLCALDVDLFPRGWQRLSADTISQAVLAAQSVIEKLCPEARRLLIVPENGVPDADECASLARLKTIFQMTGLDVRYGSIDPALSRSVELRLPGEAAPAQLVPVERERTRLMAGSFDPCTILLGNELRAGSPGILEELPGQYLQPPLQAGWSVRRRSRHRSYYMDAAKRLGKLIGVDPWLLAPLYEAPEDKGAGALEATRGAADALLAKIRRKYRTYHIMERPCLLLASDAGPRSAPVHTIYDARHITAAMLPAHPLLQEGVPTRERIANDAAEPWVYSIDRYIVGAYYCQHSGDSNEMCSVATHSRFVPMNMAENASILRPAAGETNRFYMHGVIARLALVAASYELEATDPEWQAMQQDDD